MLCKPSGIALSPLFSCPAQRKYRRGIALHKHAVSIVAEEERQRKIGIFTLMGKFLDDGRFRGLVHAVYAVESLTHAISNRGRAVIGKDALPILIFLNQVLYLRVLMIV